MLSKLTESVEWLEKSERQEARLINKLRHGIDDCLEELIFELLDDNTFTRVFWRDSFLLLREKYRNKKLLKKFHEMKMTKPEMYKRRFEAEQKVLLEILLIPALIDMCGDLEFNDQYHQVIYLKLKITREVEKSAKGNDYLFTIDDIKKSMMLAESPQERSNIETVYVEILKWEDCDYNFETEIEILKGSNNE